MKVQSVGPVYYLHVKTSYLFYKAFCFDLDLKFLEETVFAAENFCRSLGCRKEQFLPIVIYAGLLRLLHLHLYAQDRECIFLTPFSERILSTLVGITHYFSSYVPSFRV